MELFHRHNTDCLVRHRADCQDVDHCDLWITDRIQILHKQLYGDGLLPNWSTTLQFGVTEERLVVSSLSMERPETERYPVSAECRAVAAKDLTPELRFLGHRMGVEVPPLPVQ